MSVSKGPIPVKPTMSLPNTNTSSTVEPVVSMPTVPWEDRPQGHSRRLLAVFEESRHWPSARTGHPWCLQRRRGALSRLLRGGLRYEDETRFPHLHFGSSVDGLRWRIDDRPITFTTGDHDRADYAYDPRVCRIDDTYYITWCCGRNGPTIGMARTVDFLVYERMENVFLPFNRNGVLFPRKIHGRYYLLSRPSDDGHTPFGDIYVSASPDLCYWGRHRLVMRRGGEAQRAMVATDENRCGPDPD